MHNIKLLEFLKEGVCRFFLDMKVGADLPMGLGRGVHWLGVSCGGVSIAFQWAQRCGLGILVGDGDSYDHRNYKFDEVFNYFDALLGECKGFL